MLHHGATGISWEQITDQVVFTLFLNLNPRNIQAANNRYNITEGDEMYPSHHKHAAAAADNEAPNGRGPGADTHIPLFIPISLPQTNPKAPAPALRKPTPLYGKTSYQPGRI